jgi:hypothetical protein
MVKSPVMSIAGFGVGLGRTSRALNRKSHKDEFDSEAVSASTGAIGAVLIPKLSRVRGAAGETRSKKSPYDGGGPVESRAGAAGEARDVSPLSRTDPPRGKHSVSPWEMLWDEPDRSGELTCIRSAVVSSFVLAVNSKGGTGPDEARVGYRLNFEGQERVLVAQNERIWCSSSAGESWTMHVGIFSIPQRFNFSIRKTVWLVSNTNPTDRLRWLPDALLRESVSSSRNSCTLAIMAL